MSNYIILQRKFLKNFFSENPKISKKNQFFSEDFDPEKKNPGNF